MKKWYLEIVMVLVFLGIYLMMLWSLRPQRHIPGLDGPTSQCENQYHTHKGNNQ